MHLTAHSDPRAHARYVMRTTAMQSIPTQTSRPLESSRSVTIPPEISARRLRRAREIAPLLRICCSGCWTRTSDPAVNSRLLYQLS
jgi:hypothetical protein